jgi:hypothetical protein
MCLKQAIQLSTIIVTTLREAKIQIPEVQRGATIMEL